MLAADYKSEGEEEPSEEYVPHGGVSKKELKKSNEEVLKETLNNPSLTKQEVNTLIKKNAYARNSKH